tara:strand:+ start:997 stop:1329 length:333 start_codon:yes stop_codon:yes gene_type:complete
MIGSDQEINIGGENLTKDVYGALADIYRSDLNNAETEQRKLMEAEKRVSGGERKNLSFGRLRMRVCPEVYYFWANKLGDQCWKDKSFLNWIEKRFGDLVTINSKSAKVGV